MGKKIKYFFVIVFFPITIIFLLFRWIYKFIKKIIISKYIKSIDIRSIDSLSGYEFEELLYFLFSSMNFKVNKTSKSRDYGADLIISYKREKIIIQSKLYYKSSVGVSAIQEVMGAIKYYKGDYGIVITNSHYSKPAINLASSTGIILIDREFLIKLINDRKNKNLLLNTLDKFNISDKTHFISVYNN